MQSPRHLFLVAFQGTDDARTRYWLATADSESTGKGAELVRSAVDDVSPDGSVAHAIHLGPFDHDTFEEVDPGRMPLLHGCCAALALVSDPDAEPAQADRVAADLGAVIMRAFAPAPLELKRTPHGTFSFMHQGIEILYPLATTCGRFPLQPGAYGFQLVDTGGGCKAWRCDFTLDGQPVYMLLTQDAGAEMVHGEPVEMGVYYWREDDDAPAFVSWEQRDELDETGAFVAPDNIVREGTMPAAQAPAAGTLEFTALVPRIAHAFGEVLREWLTADQLAEAVALNRTESSALVCHSHDHCDANMAMEEAFQRVGVETVCGTYSGFASKQERDGRLGRSTTLWNAAWNMAKERGFGPIV